MPSCIQYPQAIFNDRDTIIHALVGHLFDLRHIAACDSRSVDSRKRPRLWLAIDLCLAAFGKVCAYLAISVRAIDSDLDIDASNADIVE